eukprot:ctg_4341.g452
MFVSVGISPTLISAAASGLAVHASVEGPRCAGSTSPTAAASTPRRRWTLRATADGQGGTSEPPQRRSGKTPRTKLTNGLSFTSEYLNALESVELPDALPDLSDMMRVDGGRDGCEQCRGTGEIPVNRFRRTVGVVPGSTSGSSAAATPGHPTRLPTLAAAAVGAIASTAGC